MSETTDDLCANLRSLKNPLGPRAADEIEAAWTASRDAIEHGYRITSQYNVACAELKAAEEQYEIAQRLSATIETRVDRARREVIRLHAEKAKLR